jgi:Xaa-Pro aminopeptidase
MQLELPADMTWGGYTLAERDRRWGAVRANAARAGLDCVLVPLCADPTNLRTSSAGAAGTRADCRYLTLFDNAVIVLPTDGRPPIVVTDRGLGNAWVPEARAANRAWAKPTIHALLDAGMERARIGVSGLKGGTVTHIRAYDGVVVHSAYEEVIQALPNASFEDATDVVGFARYVKSAEEIACLQRATAIAEAGLEEMVKMARPGVDEAELYAEVTHRLLELGSEHYHWAMNIGTFEEEGPRATEPPIGRRLQADGFITNEISTIWGGIVAQEVQPIMLGPLPDRFQAQVDLEMEVFEAGLALMKPGTSFPELIDAIGRLSRDGMKATLGLHGRGWGNDGPLLTGRASLDRVKDLTLQAGNAFVWKPHVFSPDGKIDFQYGGDVVVREGGAEVLFSRPRQGVISSI